MTEKKPQRARPGKPGGDRPMRRRPEAAGKADSSAAAKPKRAEKPRKAQAAALAPAAPKAYEGERIAKAMARAGACSRRDAEQWVADGRVAVNGRKLTSPAFNVREGDAITVDGAPLKERERTRLFLFHKPAGLVVSAKDPEGRDTVFDYLARRFPDLPRLVSVGRLDINTEGLLLLTNDGGLARTLELPATGWTRRYRVRAHGAVDQAALDGLARGVEVDGVAYAPIEAALDRLQGANAWMTLALTEGKNREVKRVLEHIGLDVNRLIRVSFGPFQLGELAEGQVEEVRLKVLREQLGKGLAELAGVDFSSPLRIEKPEPTKAATQAQRPRKHVSEIRRQRDERAESGPRQRIERAATADRKGRAVAVERVTSTKPKTDFETRNGRRFSAQRRDDEEARPRGNRDMRERETGYERPRDGERPQRGAAGGRDDRRFGERPQRGPGAGREERRFGDRPPRAPAGGERRYAGREAEERRDGARTRRPAGGDAPPRRERPRDGEARAAGAREPRRFEDRPREPRRRDDAPRDARRFGDAPRDARRQDERPRRRDEAAGGGRRFEKDARRPERAPRSDSQRAPGKGFGGKSGGGSAGKNSSDKAAGRGPRGAGGPGGGKRGPGKPGGRPGGRPPQGKR